MTEETLNIFENSTVVPYTSTLFNPEPDLAVTFVLSGADVSKFTVSTDGTITFNNSPDFETDPLTYAFTLMAATTVGVSNPLNLTINIADLVLEPPQFADTSGVSITINENNADGIYTPIPATHPEGKPITFLLIGTDAGAFNINASNGHFRNCRPSKTA